MKGIRRREFLIRSFGGVACAVLAPDFIRSALDHIQGTDQPLIVPPKKPGDILYAVDTDEDFQLNLGPYDSEPPVITWREYIKQYMEEDPDEFGEYHLEDDYGIAPDQLDEDCDTAFYFDAWCRSESPHARAVRYLESLELGPYSTRNGVEVGGLTFYDGPCPGSDYLGVHADDKVSLSCLQERLNQLGESIEIRVA